VIASSTVIILSLTVLRAARLADQNIFRKVTAEHRLRFSDSEGSRKAGVEFIAENGGGAGVRIAKRARRGK